jgi:P4 family phage/plasmid primase-like protien
MHGKPSRPDESGEAMNLFQGVHEVRVFRPSGVAVGYFDSWDAALRTIENEPSQYKAAYFTLNPVDPGKLPANITVNPQTLTPTRNTAGDADMLSRTLLLVDLDPPRPAGTNAMDAEKQAAREAAERVREYLSSRNWPEPMLCDSGNGWHLQYRVALPNCDHATDLVRGVLARLHQLFPMVDAGNFNASRLCKLYGSFARKGEHSEQRPWRRSAMVRDGSGVAVTEEQLCALVPTAESAPPNPKQAEDVKLSSLLGFLDYYGVAVRSEPREVPGGSQIEIECPWASEHSSETRRDTVVSFIAGLGNGFKCFHSHCANRRWREFRAELEQRDPGLAPYYGKLPTMTHSDIARDFVRTHDDFVSIYDRANETGVWLPATHWKLEDPKDANLRRAIRRHLDDLHERYGDPEPGKPDTRRPLKHAAFVTGVLAEVKPWLPPKSEADFDTDPALLPLPYGKVADLRLGIIREMQREDCLTRRLKVMPVEMPTPRWDSFLREITCGDDELAAYIQRLMALSISGVALHLLVFFYGSGRNGKGVLLRLLAKILRGETYTTVIRPEEVEYRRGGEDRNKRLMGRMKGKRLAYTGETVGNSLDWTLLKMLTGGDSLTGAKLYENDSAFEPTHTLVLTTNERPVLPATAAFKGRLRFVPFRADFTGREDLALEKTLEAEVSGILWRLIKTAPGVFSGDNPPLAVRDATDDVMDENDVASPFIEQCLEVDQEAVTPVPEIEAAIQQWMGTLVIGTAEISRVMAGVKTRWQYGRKRVDGHPHPVRGLVGVRVRAS